MFCNPRSWSSCSSSCSSRTPSPKVSQKKFSPEDIDFQRVRKDIAKKEGWGSERIQKAERMYCDFLSLILRYGDKEIVPWNNDLDIFWHYHILDTQKYTTDCQSLFGYYLHHDPHVEDATKHKAAIHTTKKLRRKGKCVRKSG
ncbi:MAG: hypothetical protein Q7R73_03940 [bacterium]|nr:hypothetical protein [bacterium]